MRVLYISYTGLLQPLGRSQILTYLRGLADRHRITLLTFERPEDLKDAGQTGALEAELRNLGIDWIRLRYHRRPRILSTVWDLWRGAVLSATVVLRRKIEIVHGRSYVPSMIAAALKAVFRTRFVFDMRGFWVDERVDGGSLRRASLLYRLGKLVERRLLVSADVIVSLTHAGVRDMRGFEFMKERKPRFRVIPTCTDLSRFRSAHPTEEDGSFVLGYVGSMGSYYLFREVLDCFEILRGWIPDSRLLVVNRGQHDLIRNELTGRPVPEDSVEIVSASYEDVPDYIRRMDAGIFFYMPVFSKHASSPTRMAEFLGCGVPCLANAGVGDVREILEGEAVGVAVDGFSRPELEDGLRRLLDLVRSPATGQRCVSVAREFFDASEGIRRYHEIYESLGDARA